MTSLGGHGKGALMAGKGLVQGSLNCCCGRSPVVAKGLCASCYTMKRQDRLYYGGLREKVLERDGYQCRVCGKPGLHGKRLTVHHRRPGFSRLPLLITLCRGCHSKVHKLEWLHGADVPELLRVLWRELHPSGSEQYPMDFSSLGIECSASSELPIDSSLVRINLSASKITSPAM